MRPEHKSHFLRNVDESLNELGSCAGVQDKSRLRVTTSHGFVQLFQHSGHVSICLGLFLFREHQWGCHAEW